MSNNVKFDGSLYFLFFPGGGTIPKVFNSRDEVEEFLKHTASVNNRNLAKIVKNYVLIYGRRLTMEESSNISFKEHIGY